MNLYITLNGDSDIDEQLEKLYQILQVYRYKILGNYESRGYMTVVIQLEDDVLEEALITLEAELKEQMDLLEVERYMKFYYILEIGSRSSEINPKVRGLLEKQGYQAKTYNSHSENGHMYVGLKVMDINPMDRDEIEQIDSSIKIIDGIQDIILY